MGRPGKGSLSSFPPELSKRIRWIKRAHPGWGAITILDHLEDAYGFARSSCPSIASINRFLRQQGLVDRTEKHGVFPRRLCGAVQQVHQLWELDAQGAVAVDQLGFHAMINIKDHLSRTYCMSFPVPVKSSRSQPATRHYQYSCRLAFEEFGRPCQIQVDRDSIFYDNTSKSPFPTRFHLWLIGLGIDLCIINQKPPSKQAIVERAHQTMEKQVLQDKGILHWKALFTSCNKRRHRLNYYLPCRSLDGQAPLQAFPQAQYSNRSYSIANESELFEPQSVHQFLSRGKWFRIVSKDKTVSLGRQIYYLKSAKPQTQLQIEYSAQRQALIFTDGYQQIIAEKTIKGLSKEQLLGATQKQLTSTRYQIKTRRRFVL